MVENTIPSMEQVKQFLCSMNSFLGILRHYRTYRLREHLLRQILSPSWWKLVYTRGKYLKIVIRKNLMKYHERNLLKTFP